MKMTNTTAAKAKTYHLQTTTTPENLETKMMTGGGTILTFGNRILVAGYYYDPNGCSYYKRDLPLHHRRPHLRR